jgi:hypothetical protein
MINSVVAGIVEDGSTTLAAELRSLLYYLITYSLAIAGLTAIVAGTYLGYRLGHSHFYAMALIGLGFLVCAAARFYAAHFRPELTR